MNRKNYFHKLAYLSFSLLLSFILFSPSVSASCVSECMRDYRANAQKHIKSTIKGNTRRDTIVQDRCNKRCAGKKSFDSTLM